MLVILNRPRARLILKSLTQLVPELYSTWYNYHYFLLSLSLFYYHYYHFIIIIHSHTEEGCFPFFLLLRLVQYVKCWLRSSLFNLLKDLKTAWQRKLLLEGIKW